MIDEKAKIEHLDILLENIDDIGNFNISLTLQKGMGINTDNFDDEKLKWFNSLHDSVKNLGTTHKYFENTDWVTYRLTEKGIKAKKLGGHLEYENNSKKTPLTLYNKLQLTVTLISLVAAITFGVLNYLLSLEKSDLKDENNLLKTDIVLYKDSLNLYKKKALSERQQTERDTSQTKNFGDLKND